MLHLCRQRIFIAKDLLNISRISTPTSITKSGCRSLRSSRVKSNWSTSDAGKKLTPTPFEGVRAETGPVSSSNLKKAFIFSITFSVGSFLGVSIWEYETIRRKVNDIRNFKAFPWLRNQTKSQPEWRKQIDLWWNRLSIGEKVFVPICALNVLVFGMWRIKPIQPTMIKYFCSNPAAKILCWPMCLSTFSHYSLFHIFANMYVLHSFSNAAVVSLGKEHFVGFYLSAGVISTMASYFYKAATFQAGLSLGASGAIMAILGYVCCKYPDTQLSILFLPMFTFPAGAAIKVIMGLDLAGCILRWKFFDHAAHLGGALFGMFWCYYGADQIWPKREMFLKYYHQLAELSRK